MLNVPEKFNEPIGVIYPPNNIEAYEEWLFHNYTRCDTDRIFLPINWTAFYVNHNYGNDKQALAELQGYINSLDISKKYWTCIQYDDSILNDISRLDLLQFNMSKKIGVELPLLCQPHPYKFTSKKTLFANFVGNRTHPVRDSAGFLMGWADYYISYDPHDIQTYCKILHESIFTLCYSGYGLNSFRISESIQYGSIPVYISSGDDFILPSWLNFEDFGVLIKSSEAHRVAQILHEISIQGIIKKQDKLKDVYEKYYTYEGNLSLIINELQTEYNSRKNGGKVAVADAGIETTGN